MDSGARGAQPAPQMSELKKEEVLVVRRELFDELGEFQGIEREVDRYLGTLLDPANNFFMDRATAEEDPGFKQIIPYALFRHEGRFLHYFRGKSGGEAKLHGRGSVGIGGHINPVDRRQDHLGLETYRAGVEREVAEELRFSGGFTQKMVALINDDSEPVGKVHLGVVHLFDLEDDAVTSGEDALAGLEFRTMEELTGELYASLETWSRLCVDFLAARG